MGFNWAFNGGNCAVYELMWYNMEELDRPQMAIWRMRIACWKPKVTNTHSEYVILTAFPLQELHERVLMFRLYLYMHCLSCSDSLRSGIGAMLLLNLRQYDSCLDYCYFTSLYAIILISMLNKLQILY